MNAEHLLPLLAWSGGAAVISTLLTPLIRRFAVSLSIVSLPTQDRWGHRAIARLGGIPIALGFLAAAGWGLSEDPRMMGLILAGSLMLMIGLVDDIKRLHPYTKLIAQIIAGCLVVVYRVQISLTIPWLEIPLTITWLVLMMNAFNLIDNMDGLSAGIGVLAAFFCAWHAVAAEQWLIASVAVSLGGATLGFLRYNLPPAKIFMGDTGSQVLGLGLGALSLMGPWQQSTRLLGILALPALILAIPIFDTIFVALQRITHGRSPFLGGTDHLSHRLGILGLSTRQVVFTLYGASALFGLLSVGMSSQSPIMIAVIWLLTVGGFLLIGGYLAKVRVYTDPPEKSAQIRSTPLDTMLIHKRRILEVAIDFILICAAYAFAYLLRYDGGLDHDLQALIVKSLPLVIGIKMLCFFSCGLYRGVWRYTSIPDLINIFRAVALGSVFTALGILLIWRFEGFSRTTFMIDALLLFLFVGGARVTERLLDEWITIAIGGAVPVLIVGAGDTGELLLRQLKASQQPKRRVVGFLDDDPVKLGNRIHGIPVFGTRGNLGQTVQKHRVQEILIGLTHPPEILLNQIQSYCQENGLACKTANQLLAEEALPPSSSV